MADLKKTTQTHKSVQIDRTREGDPGEHNEGAEFGTTATGASGKEQDLDRSGTSKNQGHGHPREERGLHSD